MSLIAATGEFNGLAVAIFAVVLAFTLLITRWAARRTHSTSEFYAAGRGITAKQNGLAIAGDYLSASTFLGYAGLMYLFGFDGWLLGLAALMSFIPVLYLLAERMRNSGKYTLADVLSYRLKQRPARAAAATTSLLVIGIYLIAQLVGAGALIQALAGINFTLAVVICGVFMTIYVVFGGMLATTWVQIVKAGMLMTAGVIVSVAVLAKFNFNPNTLLDTAASKSEAGKGFLGPGLYIDGPLLVISTGITIFFGTAGLPHILMRFFTVPDGNAARRSVVWTIGFIGVFTALVTIIGFGARAILGGGASTEAAVGKGGNLAAPLLAQSLGGGEGTTGGDIALALFAAAAFATILAVVAGLVLAAAGAVTHDLWTNVMGRGSEETRGQDGQDRLGRHLGARDPVHAGASAPASTSACWCRWRSCSRRARTSRPSCSRSGGGGSTPPARSPASRSASIASVVMIGLSPPVWPGPDSEGSPSPFIFPALITMPIGFLGCWLGTVLSSEAPAKITYDELLVRSELGLGSAK